MTEFSRRDFLKIAGAAALFGPAARLNHALNLEAGSTVENGDLVKIYDKVYAGQIERGYLDNVRPGTLSELQAAVLAKSATLSQTRTDRGVWITGQLGRLFYEKKAFVGKDQAQLWIQNRDVYDSLAAGTSEAMLFSDLFPKDFTNDLYTDILIKSLDTLTFLANLKKSGLKIHDISIKPEVAPVAPGLTWKIPGDVRDFAFGDMVIVGERLTIGKPEVGVVTQADINPDTTDVKVTFFNWQGTGMVKEVRVGSLNDLRNVLNWAEFGILRSELMDQMVQIRTMRNRYILNSADIPDEIKHSKLGMHVDFRKIPVFVQLQSKLLAAKTPKERGEIMMQIAARIGVQTRDGAELHEHGYVWSEEDPREKCNLYSTSFIRALGLDTVISHWALPDGTPAFNTGEELSAHDMNAWMTKYGPKYGWFPVTRTTKEQRLELLRKGYVMYGATSGRVGDTLTIYGIEGADGKMLPVLSKATWNRLSALPYRKYHFEDPMDYWIQHPEAPKDSDILWAHPGPTSVTNVVEIHGK